MLGIDPQDQRPRMEEAFDVIMRLFAGETVTAKTDWFTCDEAVLQIRPYSNFDVAVASSVSPSGSKLAGRYGTGMLSIAATEPAGFGVLDYNFKRLDGGGGAQRPRRRPRQVAADGPDAHRRDRRAGQGQLPLRAAVGVRLPQPHHPDR